MIEQVRSAGLPSLAHWSKGLPLFWGVGFPGCKASKGMMNNYLFAVQLWLATTDRWGTRNRWCLGDGDYAAWLQGICMVIDKHMLYCYYKAHTMTILLRWPLMPVSMCHNRTAPCKLIFEPTQSRLNLRQKATPLADLSRSEHKATPLAVT